MDSLRIEFGIGIGEDKNGNSIPDIESRINCALLYVTSHTGGALLTRGTGAWYSKDEDRTIIEEGITIATDMQLGGKRDMKSAREKILEMTDKLIDMFQQEDIHIATSRVFSYDHYQGDPVVEGVENREYESDKRE